MDAKKDHVAILNKQKLLDDILTGIKTIESRWYINKVAPWEKINKGDIIYFKLSGKPVTLKATADKILTFENLNPKKILSLIKQYGKEIGINETYYEQAKNKNYVILTYLKNPQLIKPFDINKAGYGCSVAWLCVDDINKVKLPYKN